MKKAIAELEAKKRDFERKAQECTTAIRAMQSVCEHPGWEDDGHDSHYSYKRCTKCGKREQR
jgi:hypothetical protein